MLNTLVGALNFLQPLVGPQGLTPLIYNVAAIGQAIATFAMFLISALYHFLYNSVVCNETDDLKRKRKATMLTVLVLCGTMVCVHLLLVDSNVGPLYELSLNMTGYIVVYICRTINAAFFQKRRRTAVSSFTLTVALVVAVTFFLLKGMRSFTTVNEVGTHLNTLRAYNFNRTMLPGTDNSKFFAFVNETIGKECSRRQEVTHLIEPDSFLSTVVSMFFNTTVVETGEEVCMTLPIERVNSEHVVSTMEDFSFMRFLGWFIEMPSQLKPENTEVKYELLFHAMCNAIYIVLALPVTTCVNLIALISTTMCNRREKARTIRERKEWLHTIIKADGGNIVTATVAEQFNRRWVAELTQDNKWIHPVYFHCYFKRALQNARYYRDVNTQSAKFECLRALELSAVEGIINHTFGILYQKVVHGAVYAVDTTKTQMPAEYFDMGFAGFPPNEKKALSHRLVTMIDMVLLGIAPHMPNVYNNAPGIDQA
jgi:hypothetical protein